MKPTSIKEAFSFSLRPACEQDLKALHALEVASFSSDRLSRRRLRHWVQAANRIFLVAESGSQLMGYGLVLLLRGTRLARMYSIAVADNARGHGLGKALMKELEAEAAKKGRLFMRLEVAQDNAAAIALYESLGYVAFGTYSAYYEDQRDALRMQKRIRHAPENLQSTKSVPWYRQTTDFTCGPAAAMMAMAALNPKIKLDQELELAIWREATTIFMTSGHGGCHPVGLALAVAKRGFKAEVFINQQGPLFVESVRNPEKKQIIAAVHEHFLNSARKGGVAVRYKEMTQENIARWLTEGAMVLVLISTYRMDYRKAPHWVTVCGIDEQCLYVHDPDPTEGEQSALDCQYLPIAREDFDKMSLFGRERLRTAVVMRSR
jgi:ribosomal protein S18 acetylase RimI-like enzyme/predicted double-glycine peptidase